MTLAPGELVGRYRVVEAVGAGGMGEVYRANDQELGRDVALKVLPGERLSDRNAAARLFSEARTASALNHPNIVGVFDVGRVDDRSFIVMEFVEGRVLRASLAERRSLDEVLRVGLQVARALAAAHRAGIVHRDIKPENIMVREDGYVKVLDFGLARASPDAYSDPDMATETATRVGLVRGTVPYMSPEQAKGQPVTAATDIFSLGSVLYEATLGRHPFLGDSRLETLSAIASRAVVAPSSLLPGLPAELDTLLLQMLEKNPRLRPSAERVEAVLETLSRARSLGAAVEQPPAGRRRTVGREGERALLEDALKQAGQRGGFLGITGEPGCGKTRLVEDFLSDLEADDRGAFVGRGQCSESLAASAAYLPLLEALEGLLRKRRGRDALGVLQLVARSWYTQIAPRVPESPSGKPPTSSASPTALKRELVAFLSEISRRAPTVIFLDDAQWADASTVDILGYLGRQLTTIRCLVVLAYRSSELQVGDPLPQVKLALQSRGALSEVVLGRLGPAAIAEYMAAEFPDHGFQEDLLELLYERTEGNALFLVDLVRDLRSGGHLQRIDGRWRLKSDLSEVRRAVPESVRSMIELKISRLDEPERRLLTCAAIAGDSFNSAILARALGEDPAEVEDLLRRLQELHAFVVQGEETELPDGSVTVPCRFAHALYRDAFRDSVVPSRRVALAGALAEALLAAWGEESTSVASELAILFEMSRDPVRAAQFHLQAARSAAALFANREVVSLSRSGLAQLEKLPPSEDRDRMELGFLLLIGAPLMSTEGYASQEAERAFTRARELSQKLGEPAVAFMMLDALAVVRATRRDPSGTRELAEELLRLARQIDQPTVLAEAHWVMGENLLSSGSLAAAQRHFDAGIAAHGGADRGREAVVYAVDPTVCCHTGLAVSYWLSGRLEQSGDQAEQAVLLAQDLGHPESLAWALFMYALLEQLRRSPAESGRQAEASIAIATEHGLAQIAAWAAVLHGWSRARLGSREEGLAEVREALAAQEAMGTAALRPFFLGLLSDSLRAASETGEALAVLDQALEQIEVTGERTHEAWLHLHRADLLLEIGDAEGAGQELARALEVARSQGARLMELRALVAQALFRLEQGGAPPGDALSRVYESFDEGLDYPDLVAARTTLDGLPP